jgi:hypothetical protein
VLRVLQTNCLTEIFVERALKRASELDHHLETTGKVFGPLHGLPISIKDQLCMEGLETTMGTPASSAVATAKTDSVQAMCPGSASMRIGTQSWWISSLKLAQSPSYGLMFLRR